MKEASLQDKAVVLADVKKRFSLSADSGDFYAVDGISFTVDKGSVTIIGGANGSGKSVLMQLIAGLIKPTAGTIQTSSQPGLIFQDAATQILGETAAEDVAVGPKNQGIPKKQIPQIVTESLEAVSLKHKAEYAAAFLSGGEKRRLAVASILAMKRDILIFDEPYANLDYPGVQDVNKLLAKLKENGKTILLLTHELEKCMGLSDHIIILKQGKKVCDTTPEDALTQPLEQWGIRNPLTAYKTLSDLVWR
ncbi:MAG: energy-coupling factor ABC transporter ATP-binding protein [Treponema sp.]|nr:energy-coupling factor ABC transporter ATP-binding protein [Treponema sp.]